MQMNEMTAGNFAVPIDKFTAVFLTIYTAFFN